MPTTDTAKELFARLHELPVDQREAYLSEACGEDAELRLHVQRLLVQAEKADEFFGDSKGVTLAAEKFDGTCSEEEGDRVGPYILRQKIGEGGFGVVWMAEQTEPISRMVALKVVKAGMDTKQVLARFAAERQALAMMDHPNIARVLDAGATTSGRPYFAMELVKGIPITRFCDEQGFDARRRLELFKDVCSAVNHAHQKGVIHRDLKPSNVMVTLAADVPVVKVIDFGIAKATHSRLTEKTLFTRFEQFLGTPVYMSPEQAALSAIDVDTRSDIYSLGVLLYELLAGSPPFDQKSLLSAGYDEMRRIIREDEPPKPSTRLTETRALTATGSKKKLHVGANALQGELDWIVMKAIEKDRTRRYETANAFAADIGRYLADEPVQAAAPSAAYRFRKFARRNKAAIGVATAMVVLLLTGIAATTWQAVRATAETDRANEAEELATQRLEESEEAREEAESIAKFLTGMFESSRPGDEGGGRDVQVADVLDQAAVRIETELANQPERRARLQSTIGRTYFALGLYADAIRELEKARDYYQSQLGLEHFESIKSLANLAAAYQGSGQIDKSLPMQKEVLALSVKVLGPEHPNTLHAFGNLAGSYFSVGRIEDALPLVEKALALTRKVNGPEHPETLIFMLNLAWAYSSAGRDDAAFEMHQQLLALSRRVHGPEHPTTLSAMGGLAHAFVNQGRMEEAIDLFERSVELHRKVSGPEHPWTLEAMNGLALSYQKAGRLEEAVVLYEQALEAMRRRSESDHPVTFSMMNTLAWCYHDGGRSDEALAMLEEVLAGTRRTLGPEHPQTAVAVANLGDLHHARGEVERAIETWREAARLDPQFADMHYQMGKELCGLKRYQEALAPLQAARQLTPMEDARDAELIELLRESFLALGREADAKGLGPVKTPTRSVPADNSKLPSE